MEASRRKVSRVRELHSSSRALFKTHPSLLYLIVNVLFSWGKWQLQVILNCGTQRHEQSFQGTAIFQVRAVAAPLGMVHEPRISDKRPIHREEADV